MKIYKEVTSCFDFDFWSGAKDTEKYLYNSEVETIFHLLEECEPDGMSETELNDFFWFEDDTIAEWLGWPDFETLMSARSGEWSEWTDTYAEFLERLEEAEEEEEEEE